MAMTDLNVIKIAMVSLALAIAGCSAGPVKFIKSPTFNDGGAPITCDNGTSFCPGTSECCKSQYSPTHWGCKWNGACCNLGPAKPPSTAQPNCIVLGDSVSIGYTPDVIRNLASSCAVQHTPWDVSDGGAGATSLGLACLDIFLRTAQQHEVMWDVIFFNFGLHNLNNATDAEDIYSEQLANITMQLQKAGKKVVYGLTTPFMPDYLLGNHVVEDLNARAKIIMAHVSPPVPVVDLYSVVTGKCGPLPYVNCSICRMAPCSYHYNGAGSELLAAAVAGAIKNALVDDDERVLDATRAIADVPGFSCDGNMTYCPASSKCCNTSIPVHLGCEVNGQCCRPGPKDPPSATLPNCVIMGDSVSDGYTPLVMANLSGVCAVQHTPWMWGGSADSTGYAVACLEHFLVTDRLQHVAWDVIFFNFGLHDMDNATSAENLYAEQLANITRRLKSASKKVIYGLTTPFMPNYNAQNHVVEQLNARARDVMSQNGVPVADLYQDVVDTCGPVPYTNCSICAKEPCSYHYKPAGYEILAATVSASIRSALSSESVAAHST